MVARLDRRGGFVADGGQSFEDRLAQPELAKAGPLGFIGHWGLLRKQAGRGLYRTIPVSPQNTCYLA